MLQIVETWLLDHDYQQVSNIAIFVKISALSELLVCFQSTECEHH